MSKSLTPLMEQYWSVKNEHPDKVILFRMGDFFEMFHEDARLAAPILNIALTQRNKKSKDNTPMCGVPHHSIAGPISKLLSSGHKVAICDQIEDPKQAKGLVARAVTRVLTPGMVYDPESLNQLEANYICAFNESDISFLDVSTGAAFYYLLHKKEEAYKFIELLNPVEFVFSSINEKNEFIKIQNNETHLSLFDKNLEIDFLNFDKLPESARRLLSYCVSMQGESLLKSIASFERRNSSHVMSLSHRVLEHLEVFKTYKGELKGSLFFAINRTKTSAGARKLKQWIQFPLIDLKSIQSRQDKVIYWQSDVTRLKRLREAFSKMGDIERRLSKISLPTCHPRDLLALSESLKAGVKVSYLNEKEPLSLDAIKEIILLIEKTINEEMPSNIKNGDFIQRGYHQQLDEYIKLSDDSQSLLLKMEAQEKAKTEIPSLKIRYNNVFGYYIEVTNVHKAKVPDHYKRKQTLTNAERYVTQELHELESKILSAKAKRLDLENEIFKSIIDKILSVSVEILRISQIWSDWDVLSSLAWLGLEQNYVMPQLNSNCELNLISSRHPVVEQEVKVDFVPNDILLNQGECFLLTGPNMAGKSTLMRQVALSVLMAQMGAPIAAQKARLPLYENIFTRIGASDHLSEGLSTFMVEMVETAELLNKSNERSLVILDEIGRGTSTFDGMSLAQSILEFIVQEKSAMTFFATHYHELTQLDKKFKEVKNVHMAIEENKKSKDLRFLYTLLSGPTNESYGIQVAELAGLPSKVIRKAQKILSQLEKSRPELNEQKQLSFLDSLPIKETKIEEVGEKDRMVESLLNDLRKTSIREMTPLEALNKISKWQDELS